MPALLFAAGMDLPCIGAKALSMGGAFRGQSDPTSVFWNPAAIANVDSSELLLLGQVIFPGNAFAPHDTLIQLNALFREGRQEMLDDVFLLGNAFAVWRPNFLPDGAFGLGIYSPTGVGAAWDILKNDYDSTIVEESGFALSVTETLPIEDFYARIGTYNFVPAFAYNPTEWLYVGVSYIYGYALLDVDLVSNNQQRMLEEMGLIFQHASLTGYEHGVQLGLQLEPFEWLHLGLSGKYESPMKFDGEFSEDVYLFYSESAPGLFPGGKAEGEAIGATAELPRPLTGGFGFTIEPRKDLTLALDLSYTNWSVMDSIRLEADTGGVLVGLPLMWEDSYRISVGAEYRFSKYAARLGAFYEPNPPVAEYQNLFLPDLNDGVALCGGVAANYNHLTMELSGEFEFFGEKRVEPNIIEEEIVNVPGVYDNSVADIILSLTYRF